MKTSQQCTGDCRTARFNLTVPGGSKLRRLLGSLIASPTRIQRYRNLSAGMLEDALEKVDGKPCT